MPFMTDTLPEEVAALPKKAQAIWQSVFNSAFRTFAGDDSEKEQAATIAAWGAVRSKFSHGETGEWSEKSMVSFEDPHGLRGRWTRAIKFTPDLMESKRRITFGEVYVPWDVDAQGDFADELTIEDAAHAFIKHFGTIGEQHRFFGGKGIPVETFTTREGDRDFKTPGTWVLGTQWSDEMWQKVLNGEIVGYSLGGDWTRIPLVAGAEFAKAKSIRGSKSVEGAHLAELDERIFERTVNAGPRVISQIIGLNVDEVSGVSLPANRQNFKLYKSGGRIMSGARKVFVIGKGAKCSCEETDEKAAPSGVPWIKLYEQILEAINDPKKAEALTREAMGDPPAGWAPKGDDPEAEKAGEQMTFDAVASKADELVGPGNGVAVASLLQAKYAAGDAGGVMLPADMPLEDAIAWAVETGTSAGILALKSAEPEESVTLLKQVKSGIKSILRHLGVKEAEQVTKEDDAMTPQERKEFDELKSLVTGIGEKLEKALGTTPPPATPATVAKELAPTAAAPAAPVEGPAIPTVVGGDGLAAPSPYELELHGRVKELEGIIEKFSSSPGTSDVQAVSMDPETVSSAKSIGYRHSSIIGTIIPTSASSAEARARAEQIKKKQARRDAYK